MVRGIVDYAVPPRHVDYIPEISGEDPCCDGLEMEMFWASNERSVFEMTRCVGEDA